jgi:hypothetical protein
VLKPIADDLKKVFDVKLVDELLASYEEAKRNFYLGGLRLSAVEGGRFCEAAFRMLEQITRGAFTPINSQINSEKIILSAVQSKAPDSVRIHIPRALRVVYDIRNKRDAAHLADGIDPNEQDATFVASTLDWILAEFIRLYHHVSADEAQRLISDLVARRAPAVQDFAGFLKVLRTDLKASDRVLLLLYERGATRATFKELWTWVHPKMRKNLRRTLDQLEHDSAYIHSAGDIYQITNSGIQAVENKKLHDAAVQH